MHKNYALEVLGNQRDVVKLILWPGKNGSINQRDFNYGE
jgi:hypothetical protein